MPNEWSHESDANSSQTGTGRIGIAPPEKFWTPPLLKKRWFIPTTGWAVSVLIHLLIAGGFLAVSVSGIQTAISERTTPVSQIEEKAVPLERVSPVPDLQMELTDLTPSTSEFLPGETAPLMVSSEEAAIPSLSQDAISVLSGSPGSSELIIPMVGKASQDAYQSSFCGAEGIAGCVCFVVDYSGSMVIAFDYVRAELKRSIEKLSPGHYFHIIFFAGGEPVELLSGQMVRATRENRRQALRFVEEMKLEKVASSVEAWQAVAGAMEKALNTKTSNGYESQLIYILTDGEFDHDQVDRAISELQKQRTKPAVINVLACGNPDNEGFLSKLAKNNQGQYRFITDEEMARQRKEIP
jgi:hypothetical protein